MANPTAKLLSLRFAASQHQRIKPWFADDIGFTLTTYVKHRSFIIVQLLHRLCDILYLQDVTNVLGDKPRLTILYYCSYLL